MAFILCKTCLPLASCAGMFTRRSRATAGMIVYSAGKRFTVDVATSHAPGDETYHTIPSVAHACCCSERFLTRRLCCLESLLRLWVAFKRLLADRLQVGRHIGASRLMLFPRKFHQPHIAMTTRSAHRFLSNVVRVADVKATSSTENDTT